MSNSKTTGKHNMKPLAHLFLATAMTLGTAFSATVQAQSAPATAQAADYTEAEVRKVDKDNKKITLKHGEIKNLDMPPMTMVFQLNDVTALDRLKAGDKVRFKAANDGGKYTVTEIQAAR